MNTFRFPVSPFETIQVACLRKRSDPDTRIPIVYYREPEDKTIDRKEVMLPSGQWYQLQEDDLIMPWLG